MSAFKTERFVKVLDGNKFTVSVTRTPDGWAVVHSATRWAAESGAALTSFTVHDPNHLMETDDFVTAEFRAESR